MANTARKPKPQQQGPAFELRRGTKPNLKNGAQIYNWWLNQLSWPPGKAQRMFANADIAKQLKFDANYFAKSLTTIFESVDLPISTALPLAEVIQIMARDLAHYVKENFSGQKPPEPAIIRPLETTQQTGPDMAAQAALTLTLGDVTFRPLLVAAQKAQAPKSTVRDWAKNRVIFSGKPLQVVAHGNSYFVSEESIARMANRFVKWPSREPAGAVTIGTTKDKSGYLGTTEAAAVLGVSARSAWLWAKEGNAPTPTGTPLDVVKCTASTERERYYIRERDVYDLKKHLPKTGLKRGRRPQQLTPQ